MRSCEMIRIDPQLNLGNYLKWLYSKDPNKPLPIGRVNLQTGEDSTFKDFYVAKHILDASSAPRF